MNFEVLETEHFLFHCYTSDRDIAADVAKKVEETLLCVSVVFSIPPLPQKFDFYICPDIESFIRISGIDRENYESWMVGNVDYERCIACVMSPHAVTDRSYNDMFKVIVHEAVHIALDSIGSTRDVPMWMSEGAAVLFADQTDASVLNPEGAPSVESLETGGFADKGGYRYAGAYVRFFLEKYGAEEFLKVYCGEKSADEFTYPGFEQEAVMSYRTRVAG